jgi:hypothetical protein
MEIFKRKRGGQPGNHNALKHGFYARAMTKDEIDELSTIGVGLVDEIILVRTIIRRVAILAKDEKDRHELEGLLDSLGAAGVRLGSMIRTQRMFFDLTEKDQFNRDISTAIGEVLNELQSDMGG